MEICKKRDFDNKGKQVLVEGVNHNLGYPYGVPQQFVMNVGRGQFRGPMYQISMIPEQMMARPPPKFMLCPRGYYEKSYHSSFFFWPQRSM